MTCRIKSTELESGRCDEQSAGSTLKSPLTATRASSHGLLVMNDVIATCVEDVSSGRITVDGATSVDQAAS
jgi:hypothetical protein